MATRREAGLSIICAVAASSLAEISVADTTVVRLPPPQMQGGKPLMEALKLRRSIRDYSARPLSPQVLSNLLWAAWGVNRSDGGRRTAPSAHDARDVEIYLAMANGVWIYDAKNQRLLRHMADDIRAETAIGQDFVKTAPLNLVYVSDAARLGSIKEPGRTINGVADSAVIAQNVYLFCASEGLATVLRGSVPVQQLERRLKLKASQQIYFAQTVGYPKS